MDPVADARPVAVSPRTPGPSDLRLRGQVAVAALALAALVELFAAAGELNYAVTVDGLLTGTESLADFVAARDQVRAFELASVLVLALAAISFLAWFHAAYRNLERAGIAGLRFKPVWAIASWLIPIAGLIWPKRLADDIWRASEPGLERGDRSWRSRSVAPLVHSWWLLCLTAVGAAVAATIANDPAAAGVLTTPQELERERLAFTLYAVAEFATAAAAVAAIRLVVATTRRQRAAFGGGEPAVAPPAPRPVAGGPPDSSPSPWAPGS
jgi:hypothetical protein